MEDWFDFYNTLDPATSTPAQNNPSAYVGGDTPGVEYNFESIVPSGVDLGSLGGVMSTGTPSDWAKLLKSFTDKATTPAGTLAGLTALYGLMGGNKPTGVPGWQGKIDPEKYTYNRKQIEQPAYVPYSGSSAPVMGRQHFESSYTPKGAAAPAPAPAPASDPGEIGIGNFMRDQLKDAQPIGGGNEYTNEGGNLVRLPGPIENTPAYDGRAVTPPTDGWGEPETPVAGSKPAVYEKPQEANVDLSGYFADFTNPVVEGSGGGRRVPQGAAAGGIMGLARGGNAKAPRYLEGATDGMADKLATSIDGEQPAALSHGEFVIPADVVSHLGNGNSKAGADQLYKMMDRIRQARTGNKKQGKRINPDKFTPGGIAGYAGGGVVAFNTGNLVTTGQGSGASMPVSSASNLSDWAAPGVTNYLEKGMALANSPYQAYKGPLVAGTSPLQQQAFTAASNLQTPAAMGQAESMLSRAGNMMGGMSYNAAPVGSTYSAPEAYKAGSIGDVYKGTGEYKAGTFENQYKGTDPYVGKDVGIDQFNTTNMQRYMNPYLSMALDPQLAEARRQSEITQMGNAAKLSQAGAYGGSRGALMQSEAQRNLGQNLANITGQGYNTAFDKAMSAFNAQQGMGLQAQQTNEASRQFGAGQALANAQNRAQYGQSAQQATEASRQFGANQALANAQNTAQYGLAGFNANEQARQAQGAQAASIAAQQAQSGMDAQRLNAQQQQFGASLGMQGLQGLLSAGTALGGLGAQQNQMGLSNLNAMFGLGNTQRGIEQEGIDAMYKQFEQERLDPYKQIQFQQSLFQGLPVSTVTGSTATSPIQQLGQAGLGAGSVYDYINTILGEKK